MPENMFWRVYFESRAGAAEQFRVEPGTYAPAHISAVHRTLPVSSEYITHVLNVSYQVQKDIAALPDRVDSGAVANAIAGAARYNLLKSLPREIWIAVKADAYRARSGMAMTFPATQ
jgi:hypothetical protein